MTALIKPSEAAAVSIEEIAQRQISFYADIRSPKSTAVIGVGDFLAQIGSGKWKPQVLEVQRLRGKGDKAAADVAKKSLPAVTFSGVFTNRSIAGLTTHSGLMCLDLDDLGDRLAEVRAILQADPYPLAVFRSPSGMGLKVVVAIDPKDHAGAFQAALDHFGSQGVEVDPSGKDVSRLCFASLDPELWLRKAPGRAQVLSAPLHFCTPAPSAISAPSTPSTPSAPPTSSAHSARQMDAIALRKARNAIEKKLNLTPRLARIFQQYVGGRIAREGERNSTMVDTVAALYHVVSEEHVLQMSVMWFDLNAGLFSATRAQHERECKAMIRGNAETYTREMGEMGKAYYSMLNVRERAAFRIVRDLGARGDDNIFFLSSDELGDRIGCQSRHAYRILRDFERDRILDQVTLGQRRAAGSAPRATEWRWKPSQLMLNY